MKSVIVFGSKYGSSKQYAAMLAQNLQIDCFDYKEFDMSKKYDVLIYIGALYAGGVTGLTKIFRNYPPDHYEKWMIVTVGGSDPENPKNAEAIKANIYRQLPKNLKENKDIDIFHLRGSIDYSGLHLQHRLMMKFLYQKVKKIPVEQLDEETKDFLATYNKKADFINFDSLLPIIDRYSQMIKKS